MRAQGEAPALSPKLTQWKRLPEEQKGSGRHRRGTPKIDRGVVYQSHAALITPRTGAGAGDRNQFHLGLAEHSKAAACKADVRMHRVGESPTPESTSCRRGGTGRRTRSSAWRPRGREGSKPSAGTNQCASTQT